MAGLDFSPLIENAFDPLKALQAYGKAQTTKLEGLKTQRQEQTRVGVGQSLARRDLVGARTTALRGGDTGLADAIGKLSDDERKATADGAQAFGSAAYALRQVPKEQRAQAFDQGVGALAGIVPPEQLAQARSHLERTGWDDAAVDGYINAATTVDKLLAAQPKPTAAQLDLQSAGIQPGTPEYQAAILGHVNPSQFMEFGSDATGRQLIQTRGMGVGAPTAPSGPAIAGPQIEQLALSTVPGTRVTSGARTAEHNAAVGGVGNSFHLTDQARDLVPPQGMSVGQLYQTLRPSLAAQGMRVINEGDHVHVEPASRSGSGGPRVVAQTAPVARENAENKAPSGYRWAAGGALEPIPGGPGDKQGRQANLKPIPAPVVKNIVENRGTLRQIDQAIAAIQKRPKSIGFGTGYLGDQFTQQNDPDGTTTRAAVGKIAGQIIHDVSGAAVTLSEEPRFKPYVPTVTDSPKVAIDKLRQLRRLAADTLNDVQGFYSEEQGYKPFSTGRAPPPVAKASLPQGWSVKKVN